MRDLDRTLEDYRKTVERRGGPGKDPFFAMDHLQIINRHRDDLYKAVSIALDFGFIVGYRAARYDLKKRHKKEQKKK